MYFTGAMLDLMLNLREKCKVLCKTPLVYLNLVLF
uniref:Uncharacterized protein n=1 Tax=Gloeothece verrucosa (strain PCC 7822) TaxID=497965 RepID=E0UAV3_GLOV7|nr:hypothetical protein Cyan7822_3121 [Gloeothece verrucosa PCC 7822]